jgi:hypothetical protein
MARGDEMIHLPLESREPAEGLGIDLLDEDGAAPALGWIGAAEPGEPGR